MDIGQPLAMKMNEPVIEKKLFDHILDSKRDKLSRKPRIATTRQKAAENTACLNKQDPSPSRQPPERPQTCLETKKDNLLSPRPVTSARKIEQARDESGRVGRNNYMSLKPVRSRDHQSLKQF